MVLLSLAHAFAAMARAKSHPRGTIGELIHKKRFERD